MSTSLARRIKNLNILLRNRKTEGISRKKQLAKCGGCMYLLLLSKPI